MSQTKALVIIVEGVEEVEATAPIDILRRAGVNVTVASASEERLIEGRNGIRLQADVMLEDAGQQSYDLLVVPGGPGHKKLLENERVIEMLAAQKARGGFIGSICAGPVVLKKAGILEGRQFTSFPGTAEELPERNADSPVVVDGPLVTSQGAGTAILFALALVEVLKGKDKRQEIAASICHPD